MKSARTLLPLALAAFLVVPVALDAADEAKQESAAPVPIRPQVPGLFQVRLRTRAEKPKGSGKIDVSTNKVKWHASETAVIICDMWNGHYCQLAAQRVDKMAPQMNEVVTAARNHGALIIHAPSGCMNVYADTPHRRRIIAAPFAKSPIKLGGWCYLDPKTEAEMPVDVSNSACDDPVVGKKVRRYDKQHDAIKIIGFDGISDNGQEVYNALQQHGIKNVVMMGVHTNMCVLGRPFGIRQLVRLGFNVALARDLTDSMYDPREFPYVSHTRGTELVVEHIERYWCPSIMGADVTRVIPGSNDPDPEIIKRRGKPVAAKKP